MSLINQMLKDLEKRRAVDVAGPTGPLKGVTRYCAIAANNTKHTGLLMGIFILLAMLLGFFGWQYWLKGILDGNETAATNPAGSTTKPVKQKTQTAAENTNTAKARSRTESRAKTGAKTSTGTRSGAKSTTASKSKVVASASRKKQIARKQIAVTDSTLANDMLVADPARPLLKQRRPLHPQQQAELIYKKAYIYLQRGQTVQAEGRLRRALKEYPRHIRAREMLAGVYIKAGRYVEAGELLRRGIELEPDHRIFAKLYARVLLEQENLGLAVRVLEQRLPAIHSDPDHYAFLAALYQRQGEHFKAASHYRDILKLQPAMGVWWVGLGISLEKLDKTEEARAAYERARISGTLAAGLVKYTDNRLAALKDIGYPDD